MVVEVGVFEVGRRYGAVALAGAAASEWWREARGAGGSLGGFYLYLTDVHQVGSLGQIDRRLCAIVAKVLVGLPWDDGRRRVEMI